MGVESSPGRTHLIRRLGSVSYWEEEDEKVFVLETERSGRQLQSQGGYFDCTHRGGGGVVSGWLVVSLCCQLQLFSPHTSSLSSSQDLITTFQLFPPLQPSADARRIRTDRQVHVLLNLTQTGVAGPQQQDKTNKDGNSHVYRPVVHWETVRC